MTFFNTLKDFQNEFYKNINEHFKEYLITDFEALHNIIYPDI